MRIFDLPDPYEGFDISGYQLDLHGWGSTDGVFSMLIDEIRPKTIIEVGTWKGASAIHMAKLSTAQIVCVDTWLGALEFWRDRDDENRFLSLNLKNGYPTVYYQFLANVVHSNCQDRITPFPQTSLIAARYFAEKQAQADMIYIDASHDEEDVAADLRAYWPLVRHGGVLFGDDYDTWQGVRSAVNIFAQELIATHQVRAFRMVGPRHWSIWK